MIGKVMWANRCKAVDSRVSTTHRNTAYYTNTHRTSNIPVGKTERATMHDTTPTTAGQTNERSQLAEIVEVAA